MTEEDHGELVRDSGNEPRTLAAAYVELNKQLTGRAVGAEQLKELGNGFRRNLPHFAPSSADILADSTRELQQRLAIVHEAFAAIDDIEPDRRPDEIVANTSRSAELISEQNKAIAQLVELTLSNLALAQTQHEQARRTEKFAKAMSWASVSIAGASLATAIVAVLVTAS